MSYFKKSHSHKPLTGKGSYDRQEEEAMIEQALDEMDSGETFSVSEFHGMVSMGFVNDHDGSAEIVFKNGKSQYPVSVLHFMDKILADEELKASIKHIVWYGK